MADRSPLAETIQAFSLIITMLVEDLEKKGVMRRTDFANRLRSVADDAESAAPEALQASPRVDLQIARLTADFLAKPRAEFLGRSWTPIVIDGGRPDADP
jgi:hypothetical protein